MMSVSMLWSLALCLLTTSASPLATEFAESSSHLVPRAIWQPQLGATWQIVLSRTLDINPAKPAIVPDVTIYDIDMFLHQHNAVIPALHKLDKKVICYFSAGSYEPDRPDSALFPKSALGKELVGWPGEYWVDVRNPVIRGIMVARIQVAAQMGCDAIDPDNVDGFDNDNGLSLSQQDLTSYVKFLAAEAAKHNIGIGLKNALAILPAVQSVVQFAVNEQCSENSECSSYNDFAGAGKPVFHIEYTDFNLDEPVSAEQLSRVATNVGTVIKKPCIAMQNVKSFSTVVKTFALDGKVTYCNGNGYQTATQ